MFLLDAWQAVSCKDASVLSALLDELADVNAKDLGGFTALMHLGMLLCTVLVRWGRSSWMAFVELAEGSRRDKTMNKEEDKTSCGVGKCHEFGTGRTGPPLHIPFNSFQFLLIPFNSRFGKLWILPKVHPSPSKSNIH